MVLETQFIIYGPKGIWNKIGIYFVFECHHIATHPNHGASHFAFGIVWKFLMRWHELDVVSFAISLLAEKKRSYWTKSDLKNL
jgi:hypothetical protein